MKLVHISDIHINSSPILQADPVENFARCLAHVEAYHQDADRVVITGDLTHHGETENYRTLQRLLEESRLSGQLQPRLLIGNHDDRGNFRDVFDGKSCDEDGFVQWTELTPVGLFVYMDTNEPGTHEGHYCDKRRGWLKRSLDLAREKSQSVWLFMHQSPIKVHVACADVTGLIHGSELRSILSDNADIIRHVFFGHCHFTLSGSVDGIPYSAPRSTNHPSWPEFSGDAEVMGYGGIDPNYNVCFLSQKGVVVHSIDFLQEDRVNWQRLSGDGWFNGALAG